MGETMIFPDTFEEFAKQYGFKDDIYTNGAMLIPTFRVKQWLQHTEQHGHWIKHKADPCGWRGCDTVECSNCHAEQRYLLDDNYCPNCGAIMDEETKE